MKTEQAERAAFEAAMQRSGDEDLCWSDGLTFFYPDLAWQGWKARAELAPPQSVDDQTHE